MLVGAPGAEIVAPTSRQNRQFLCHNTRSKPTHSLCSSNPASIAQQYKLQSKKIVRLFQRFSAILHRQERKELTNRRTQQRNYEGKARKHFENEENERRGSGLGGNCLCKVVGRAELGMCAMDPRCLSIVDEIMEMINREQ